MWNMLRVSSRGDPDLASATVELLQSTSRSLIVAVGLVFLVWHIVSPMLWPDAVSAKVLLITPAFALTTYAALRLLEKRFLLAQAVWQVGLV